MVEIIAGVVQIVLLVLANMKKAADDRAKLKSQVDSVVDGGKPSDIARLWGRVRG